MSMFITTVGQLNKRGTISELDDALSNAIKQVRLTGKAATITYQIKIKPNSGDGETVELSDNIKVATANPARKTSIFYTTEDGRITRDNPDQPELPIKAVEGGLAEETHAVPMAAAM